MKASSDGSTHTSLTGTGVVIRRARPGHLHVPQPADMATTLRAEFRALRLRLPGATPEERARTIARLNEILRLQKALEDHAHFFLPERLRFPEEMVH